MRPVDKSKLVNTVTIYNLFRNPDTGELKYLKTFLRFVRIMQDLSSVNVGVDGWTRKTTVSLLIDRRNSQGYTGATIKPYIDSLEWGSLSDADKAQQWTLQEGDLVVNGECPADLVPEQVSEFKALNRVWAIQYIHNAIDFDGSIHSRRVGFV